MALLKRWHLSTSALLVAGLLSACGGGGGGGTGTVTATVPVAISEPGAPALTDNTETDGFNWFNFRRSQIGIPGALSRNTLIDRAARNHSGYQTLHGIRHDEVPNLAGFTGVDQLKRQNYVGYYEAGNYAFGEVIAATSDSSGVNQAEELITAIYHRFTIFEPRYKEAGVGAASSQSGLFYVTTNFAANNGLGDGIGRGKIVVYPFDTQTNVLPNFASNTESPDPVPEANEVGYPISVHADLSSQVVVTSFTVRPRGGSNLTVKSILPGSEHTPPSAAAIIPMSKLSAKAVYDVSFTGTVDGVAVTKSWSFTTR